MLRKAVVLCFGGAIAWALLRYGATEVYSYSLLFLLLLPAALIATLMLPTERLGKGKFACLVLVGLFLLFEVFRQETLLSRGYIILSLGWVAFLVTLLLTLDDAKGQKAVFLLLLVLGSAEAMYGLVQAIGGIDYIGTYYRNLGRMATGTLINRNHFAGLLNMTLPLALGTLAPHFSALRTKSHLRSELYAQVWLILVGCSFMGLAVLLSRSRAGTVTMLASLILITTIAGLRKRKRRSRGIPSLSVCIVLLLILGLGVWVGLDALLVRFSDTDSDLMWRTEVYRGSLRLIKENVLLGVGPRMYEWRYRPYQNVPSELLLDFAHNDYLQTAAEWGLPLALLFWCFVLWRLHACVRVFFDSHDPQRAGMALGCAAAIFAILLHSFVDFNLQIPTNWIIFCIVLAMSTSLELKRGSRLKPEDLAKGLSRSR